MSLKNPQELLAIAVRVFVAAASATVLTWLMLS
jgi:hypothetical protein